MTIRAIILQSWRTIENIKLSRTMKKNADILKYSSLSSMQQVSTSHSWENFYAVYTERNIKRILKDESRWEWWTNQRLTHFWTFRAVYDRWRLFQMFIKSFKQHRISKSFNFCSFISKIFIIASYDECFSIVSDYYVNFEISLIDALRESISFLNIKCTDSKRLHEIKLNNRKLLKRFFKQLKWIRQFYFIIRKQLKNLEAIQQT